MYAIRDSDPDTSNELGGQGVEVKDQSETEEEPTKLLPLTEDYEAYIARQKKIFDIIEKDTAATTTATNSSTSKVSDPNRASIPPSSSSSSQQQLTGFRCFYCSDIMSSDRERCLHTEGAHPGMLFYPEPEDFRNRLIPNVRPMGNEVNG